MARSGGRLFPVGADRRPGEGQRPIRLALGRPLEGLDSVLQRCQPAREGHLVPAQPSQVLHLAVERLVLLFQVPQVAIDALEQFHLAVEHGAQQAAQPLRRIGVLCGYDGNNPLFRSYVTETLQALSQMGWESDRNVQVIERWPGGDAERTNLAVVSSIGQLLDEMLPTSPHRPHERLITFVADRPAHDRRGPHAGVIRRRRRGFPA